MSSASSAGSTKYLAVGNFPGGPLTPEQSQMFVPKQAPALLRLYLDGKMDQFWLRQDHLSVVLVMTTATADEAAALLQATPLCQANLLEFDLIPIGPLSPLGILIEDAPSAAHPTD